jgi:Aminoglycoside-2''-adenylyltransferase
MADAAVSNTAEGNLVRVRIPASAPRSNNAERRRVANPDDQLAAIGRLDKLFDRDRVDYWLFGGWAVDFHAGVVTRDHADIDIVVWRTDAAAVHALLTGDGWAKMPEQDGYTTYTRHGLHLDLAFLARDGEAVYTPLESGRGEWPAGSFGEDVGEVGGAHARVVSAGSLLVDKSQHRDDLTSAMKDAADVAVLRSEATKP